jgi:hypothetical protein
MCVLGVAAEAEQHEPLVQVRGWRGFAQAEWWYILLSLTSKQLLAWVTYGKSQEHHAC